MRHKMLRPFIVKVSPVLCYFPLSRHTYVWIVRDAPKKLTIIGIHTFIIEFQIKYY